MDRPYRRRVRTPSPPHLRAAEGNAERGAIGGGRRYVYHHHHYHHHHRCTPSPSPSPPRRRRRSPSVERYRRFNPVHRRPVSRDPSPHRQRRRWVSPLQNRRSGSQAESLRVQVPAQGPLVAPVLAAVDRSPSPQLPPIVVRRNRSSPPRVPLPVRPASTSSIASSFLFPRPISPAQPPQPSLVSSAPPADASAPGVVEVSRSSSSVEKSIAERPFDEVPESEGRHPLPPPLPSDSHPHAESQNGADPLLASIDEAERLLSELSFTVESIGVPSGPVQSSSPAPAVAATPSSPPFDWDSLSGLVPISDSDSFRSDSSHIPELVNRSRSELSLLIRSELFNILDEGVARDDAWTALLNKFLEEACSSAEEFRALFTFACDTARDETFEQGFIRICDEVLRS